MAMADMSLVSCLRDSAPPAPIPPRNRRHHQQTNTGPNKTISHQDLASLFPDTVRSYPAFESGPPVVAAGEAAAGVVRSGAAVIGPDVTLGPADPADVLG